MDAMKCVEVQFDNTEAFRRWIEGADLRLAVADSQMPTQREITVLLQHPCGRERFELPAAVQAGLRSGNTLWLVVKPVASSEELREKLRAFMDRATKQT
jgi:hypothetical protein